MAVPSSSSSKNPFLDPQLMGGASTSATSPGLGAEAFSQARPASRSSSGTASPSERRSNPSASPKVETAGPLQSSSSSSPARTTYAPPSLPPPGHEDRSPISPTPTGGSVASSTYAPPPGPPPPSAGSPSAPTRQTEPAYAPTTQPTPGRPLLKDGKLLVYPRGFNCGKCMNTGYKSFDPSHPCKKCWSSYSVPFSKALLASFGIPTSSSAGGSSSSATPFAETRGKTLQKPLPVMNGMQQGRWGAGAGGPVNPGGGPWSPPQHAPPPQQQPYHQPPPPLQPQHSGWHQPCAQQPMHTGGSWHSNGPFAPPPQPPPGVHPALAARAPVHRTEEAREAERGTATTGSTAGTGDRDGVDEDGVPTGEAPPAYDEVVGSSNTRPMNAGGGAGPSTAYAPPSAPPGASSGGGHDARPGPTPSQQQQSGGASSWGGSSYGAPQHAPPQGGAYGAAPYGGWHQGHPPGPAPGPWPTSYYPPPHAQGPYSHPHHPHAAPLVLAPGDPRMGGHLCPKCGGDGIRSTMLGLVEETCNRCMGAGRVFR